MTSLMSVCLVDIDSINPESEYNAFTSQPAKSEVKIDANRKQVSIKPDTDRIRLVSPAVG
jgi:hypothetical protein